MLVTVEVIHDGVFNLLSDMERLNLIKVSVPADGSTMPEKKLSQKFAGALCLSDTVYETYQNVLREGRSEWDKGTY